MSGNDLAFYALALVTFMHALDLASLRRRVAYLEGKHDEDK